VRRGFGPAAFLLVAACGTQPEPAPPPDVPIEAAAARPFGTDFAAAAGADPSAEPADEAALPPVSLTAEPVAVE
jgi:hypothetical protein